MDQSFAATHSSDLSSVASAAPPLVRASNNLGCIAVPAEFHDGYSSNHIVARMNDKRFVVNPEFLDMRFPLSRVAPGQALLVREHVHMSRKGSGKERVRYLRQLDNSIFMSQDGVVLLFEQLKYALEERVVYASFGKIRLLPEIGGIPHVPCVERRSNRIHVRLLPVDFYGDERHRLLSFHPTS